jgi:hypothetical protein
MESTAVAEGAAGNRPGLRRLAGLAMALAVAAAVVMGLAASTIQPVAAEKVVYHQDSPEAAYHSFHIAIVAGDAEALRRLALPLADDEFAALLNGDHLSRDDSAGLHRALGGKRPLARLKPGDVVTLPGGVPFTIRPEQVGDDRAVLLAEGSAIPTDLRRVDGVWKVDARPIVAGRKAAAARGRRP